MAQSEVSPFKDTCSPHVTRKCLRRGGGGGSGAVQGESFTGGLTKGLLLVKNSMMQQGVTLLHAD
jgi:hypothetical protein